MIGLDWCHLSPGRVRRCADRKDRNDGTGVWNQYDDLVDHPGARINWGNWAITGCAGAN